MSRSDDTPPPDREPPRLSSVRYEDLAVGRRFGPFTERLGPGDADALRGAVGEDRPGDEAPLGVLPMLTLRALRRALDGIVPGGVLLGQHFAAVEGLPATGPVEIDVRVGDRRHRSDGRLVITFAFALAAEGRTRAHVDWTILAP